MIFILGEIKEQDDDVEMKTHDFVDGETKETEYFLASIAEKDDKTKI